MNKKLHFMLLTGLTVLVMVVSAVQPMVVRADDSTPAAPAAPASSGDTSSADTSSAPGSNDTQAPAAASTSAPASNDTQAPAPASTSAPASNDTQAPAAADTSVAPASTAVPPSDTSVAPAGTSVPATDGSATSAPTDTTAAPTDTSTLVGTVPTGTSVVVLDATGTPVPLASQAAATIIATGDPQFCTSLGYCGASETSIGAALADAYSYSFSAGETGTITVAAGPFSENVSILGSSFTAGSAYVPDTFELIGAGSGSTTLNGFISISGMKDFLLQGFNISGGSSGSYVSADSNNGTLTVQDVNVTNTSTNNSGHGINVTNHSGNVHLSGVNSSGNTHGNGAYLDNTASTGNINVDTSTFDNNGGHGLEAYSGGAISLDYVTAEYNNYDGAYLATNGTDVSGASIYVDVDPTTKFDTGNDSFFSYNKDTQPTGNPAGLEAYGPGDFYLSGLSVYDNYDGSSTGGVGAYLDNASGGGNVYLDTSTFVSNWYDGLDINSNGAIDLSYVYAAGNGVSGWCSYSSGSPCGSLQYGGGVYLDNSGAGSLYDVQVVSGANPYGGYFGYNYGDGLDVYSDGNVILDNVTADCNGIDCTINKTLTNSDGAYINTSGNVYVDTDPMTGPTGNSSRFGDPGSGGNGANGLEVNSQGDVILYDVTAYGNSVDGVLLGSASNPISGNICINTNCAGAFGGTSQFNSNDSNGLEAYAQGMVTMAGVTANGNTNDGAKLGSLTHPISGNIYVDTDSLGTLAPIPASTFGQYGVGNGENGLEVYSNGTITLDFVMADYNNWDGAYLHTTGSDGSPKFNGSIYIDASATAGVPFEFSDFSDNGGNQPSFTMNPQNPAGLEAYGPGSFVLWNITADCNGTNCNGPVPVYGANPTNGIYLDNTSGTCSASTEFCGIWLENGAGIGGQFYANSGNGIVVKSNGEIALDATKVWQSGYDGALLDNCLDTGSGCTGSGNIYVGVNPNVYSYSTPSTSASGWTNTFNENVANGLEVYSYGDISLSNVVADANGSRGALLSNANTGTTGNSTGTISVGSSTFGDSTTDGNGYIGLEVYSNQNIALANVTADYNGTDGAVLDDTGHGFNGAGTIYVDIDPGTGATTGTSEFNGNHGNVGLWARSNQGNITLENVTASNNNPTGSGIGASLGSIYPFSNGNLSIDPNGGNSSFSGNGYRGLWATFKGDIRLVNVTADNNGISTDGDGAFLDTCITACATGWGSIYVASSVFGDSTTGGNGGNGLEAYTVNGITLNGVSAQYNGGDGAMLGNSTYLASGNILVDPSIFNNNWFDGLAVSSNGAITLTDITADNNGQSGVSGSGAVLDNHGAPSVQNITVNTSSNPFNDFSNNYNNGLKALSKGNIALYDVVASNNGWGSGAGGVGDGAYLDNTSGTASTIKVDNSHVVGGNGFNSNGGNGLYVTSHGTITLNSVVADINNYDGAYLTTTGSDGSLNFDASIYVDSNSGGPEGTWSDFSGNQGNGILHLAGLEAYGPGTIVLSNVKAVCNGIDPSQCYGGPDYPDFSGISKNVNGVYLDNTSGSCPGGTKFCGIWIENSIYGEFGRNSANGIAANSKGDIDLDLIYAGQNNFDGASLNAGNSIYVDFTAPTSGSPSYVSSGHSSDFSRNNFGGSSPTQSGLEAYAHGDITLRDVTADCNGNFTYCHSPSSNSAYGAYLDNHNGTGAITVDNNGITGSDGFDYNVGSGLFALSKGDINLTDVIAEGNDPNDYGYVGANLDNHNGPNTSTVTVDNSAIIGGHGFNNNGDYGLYVRSNGSITLTNVNANGNDPYDASHGYGAFLRNNYPGSTGGISITGGGTSSFSNNPGYGLSALSNGDISLTSVIADGNDWNNNGYVGAELNNSSGPTTSTITLDNSLITGGDGFNDNGGGGLRVNSKGAITLINVNANGNDPHDNFDGNGAYLENDYLGSTDGISIVNGIFGDSITGGNAGDGLGAFSNGAISLTGVSADSNNYDGAFLDNCGSPFSYCGSTAQITVDSSTFGNSATNGNNAYGLEIYSGGMVALTDVIADYNNFSGAKLGDPYIYLPPIGGTSLVGNAAANVVVTGGDFSYNQGNGFCALPIIGCSEKPSGLEVYTAGDISLSDVTASSNVPGSFGAYLENDFGSGNVNVDPSTFNNNGVVGLAVYSNGTVTLSDVTADNNMFDGAWLLGSSITVTNSHFDGNGSSGLYMDTGSATIICSSANNNTIHVGLYGNVTGTLTLDGVSLTGNGSGGNYVTSGGLVIDSSCNPGGGGGSSGSSGSGGSGSGSLPIPNTGSLPWNTVNVQDSGDQGHGLDCTQYAGTELVLPNSDHVMLPCPIGSVPGTSGTLHGLTSSNLPGKLDGKYTFLSGLDASVNPALTGGMMTVSFVIPSGKQGSNFAILHWDGTKWVSLGGSATPPGYFSVDTSLTGDFILVTQ